jgi:hypothetical protein
MAGGRRRMTGFDATAGVTRWRGRRLIALSVLMVAVAALVTPVAQDPAYHHVADQRALDDVPNFLNVASNLPFLLVSALGLTFLARNRRERPGRHLRHPRRTDGPTGPFSRASRSPDSAPPTITGSQTTRPSSGTAC